MAVPSGQLSVSERKGDGSTVLGGNLASIRYCPVCGGELGEGLRCSKCGETIILSSRRRMPLLLPFLILVAVIVGVATTIFLKSTSIFLQEENGFVVVPSGISGQKAYVDKAAFPEYASGVVALGKLKADRALLRREKEKYFGDLDQERRIEQLVTIKNNEISVLQEKLNALEHSSPLAGNSPANPVPPESGPLP
ncbi:MAG: hypothetical protein WC712_02245 [Candidatus Brocadiia bacterium]